MGLNRIGNWNKVKKIVNNLQADMEFAQQLSLKRFGLKAESIAVKHISAQDLNWQRLAASTLSNKLRSGYSENILVATGTYFQNITSFVKSDTVFVGVKKEVRTKEGTKLSNIAEVHEFGSRSGKIPARPLWRPSLKETIEWSVKNNSPADIFLSRLRKRL